MNAHEHGSSPGHEHVFSHARTTITSFPMHEPRARVLSTSRTRLFSEHEPRTRPFIFSLSDPGHIAKMPRNLVSSFIILPLSFRKGWRVIVGGLTLSTITSHEHASSPVHDHGGCPRAFSFDHSSCLTRW